MTQTNRWVGLLLMTWCAACSSQEQPQTPDSGPAGPLTLSELLPLKDNTVSSFETTNDLGETGMFVLEISRPRPDMAKLSIAGEVQRVLLESKGISHATGGYLLRLPLEEDATFPGAFGTVTLTEVGHEHQVPAGTFDRCVTTVEESTRPPKRATSVYCSEVGLVELVVEGAGDADVLRMEARLATHGPRVDLSRPSPPPASPSPNTPKPEQPANSPGQSAPNP